MQVSVAPHFFSNPIKGLGSAVYYEEAAQNNVMQTGFLFSFVVIVTHVW